jgi:hypothetical protein
VLDVRVQIGETAMRTGRAICSKSIGHRSSCSTTTSGVRVGVVCARISSTVSSGERCVVSSQMPHRGVAVTKPSYSCSIVHAP